ncbi:hypothetical protein T440DRAFT_387236 [Plenodomus tracheiphilus IPT5]|uniref:gamma-glutamylcyclotransferase n=1 Tax=Plenodomus tracheiphilus IPT5 TaxID=1408161 RepID=A0A6A7BGN5_9PLEO|nr:hypothetical protein T440DRAFT_387236 [Plenodomus tracheiphilus IPT5]
MTDSPVPLYKSLPKSLPKRLAARLQPGRRAPAPRNFAVLAQTPQARLDASRTDEEPFDVAQLEALPDLAAQGSHEKSEAEAAATTVLYLAYGSNLCNETFRGVRGIRPLSQVNVLVPSLRLTFDLPGIPYSEPCFANTARRDPDAPNDDDGYHKNRWHKGLVGVVYEVTRRDYAHIIATEGGGSAYSDILVDCHVLPAADTVPSVPDCRPFKAHTLFAPLLDDHEKPSKDRITRPDPSYAQPSARYLKLITDGAAECRLPQEYQDYLHDIRPYIITSKRQAAGKALFLAMWLPFVMLIFSLSKQVQDKKGRAPWWCARISAWIFLGMWTSYDNAFKHVFGDGERTVAKEALWKQPNNHDDECAKQDYAERERLLEQSVESMNLYASASRVDSRQWKNGV